MRSTPQGTAEIENAARDRTKVFISYSRVDQRFVSELVAGLEYDGTFEVLIDTASIEGGEEWRNRLRALIAEADSVIAVLTPTYLSSEVSHWEIEEAFKLSKRVVPVQAASLKGLAVPERLSALNYVRFDQEEGQPPRIFMTCLAGLRKVLDTDLGWVRMHSRLLSKAAEWQGAGRIENRMLVGDDIALAKKWLERFPKSGPFPTELHRDYIAASERAEAARLSAERKRVEILEQAFRRTRMALALAVCFGIAVCIATIYSVKWARSADHSAKVAEMAERQAATQRDVALESQSRHLTDLAAGHLAQGDSALAMLLALSALPAPKADAAMGPHRPYVAGAERHLYEATFRNKTRRVLAAGAEIRGVAVSPDGRLLAVGRPNGIAILDGATGEELNALVVEEVSAFAFATQGTTVALATSDAGLVQLWNWKDDRLTPGKSGAESRVMTLCTAMDGGTHILVTEAGDVLTWDPASPPKKILALSSGSVRAAVCSANGNAAAVIIGATEIKVFDKAREQVVATVQQGDVAVDAVALSDDGTLLAMARDKTLQTFTVAPLSVKSETNLNAPLRAVAFQQGREDLVAATDDGRLMTWSRARGDQPETVRGTAAFRGLARGARSGVVALALDDDAVHMIDPDGTQAVRITPGLGPITAIAPGHAAHELVVGSGDGRTRFVDLERNVTTDGPFIDGGAHAAFAGPDLLLLISESGDARLWQRSLGGFVDDGGLKGHSAISGAISRTGRYVALGTREKTAKVWDVKAKAFIAEFTGHVGAVAAVAFTHNEKQVLVASATSVRRWDIERCTQLTPLLFRDPITSIAVSDDGRLLLTGGRQLKAWDAMNGAPEFELAGHTGEVSQVAFGLGSAHIIAALADGGLAIWRDGALVGRLPPETTMATLNRVIPTPGQRAMVVAAGEELRVFPLFASTDALVAKARALSPRCMTERELQMFHLEVKPPRWCVTGATQGIKSPDSWRPFWPYQEKAWRQWVLDTGGGKAVAPPFSEAN